MNTLIMMINVDKYDEGHIEVELWASKLALKGHNDDVDESLGT